MTIYIVSSGKGTKLIPENMRIGQGSFNRRRANNPRREPARESRRAGTSEIVGWEVYGRCTLPLPNLMSGCPWRHAG